MPEATRLLRRVVAARSSDVVLAAAVVAWALTDQASLTTDNRGRWAATAVTLAYGTALAIRRRWPVAAAVLASAVFLLERPLGLDQVIGRSLEVFSWTPFLLTYALGTTVSLGAGLAASLLMTGAFLVENRALNPFVVVITVGPWLAGRIVSSHRRITGQLEARNCELEAERERFAAESVRYERARIARELHDIVAHCLSLIVVQAGAGQRLAQAGRDGATATLSSIGEAAAQAQTEISRLVEMLGPGDEVAAPPGLALVDELVRRAAATGVAVTCRLVGDHGRLAPAASDVAYRVVQEALTNALKHAPGAPVDVAISETGRQVTVEVVNAAPESAPSGLEAVGGSHGLTGMRDRVAACGGSFTAGPIPAGGWRVSAQLPGTAAPLT
jgi:signal transduction histidine kinase